MVRFLSLGSLKGNKATAGTTLSTLGARGLCLFIMRLFQFVMGLVVIGLYAQDLDRARKAGKYVDSKWVWATVCGTWGALFSLILAVPSIQGFKWAFCIDFLTFFFYLVAFGIFGHMFIKEDPEGNKGIIRMKNAVWVLLTNMLLWIITAIYGAVMFWKNKTGRTVHTGRAPQEMSQA